MNTIILAGLPVMIGWASRGLVLSGGTKETWWEKRGDIMSMIAGEESRGGKVLTALSIVGIILGAFAITGTVLAQAIPVQVFNGPYISVNATFVSAKAGGGDAELVTLTVCAYTAGHLSGDSILSARILAYSSPDLPNATVYARVGFHHETIPTLSGGSVCQSKLVRIHHWSEARLNANAYVVATGAVKRDGLAYPLYETSSLNIANLATLCGC